MCVIILKQPGIVIPFAKLESACIVNSDGWGFAIADRGKIEYVRGLDKRTNPEGIAKILEAANHLPLMLHLRYVTVGERNLDNCHPFSVLNRDEHDVDVAFSHNGTLWSYRDKDAKDSDSNNFNQQFVQPLYARTAAYMGTADVLKDEFTTRLMEEKAGANSLFGLIDGNGIMAGIGNFHDMEGWWASNTYSFNSNHRTKTTETKTTTTTYGYANSPSWYDDYEPNMLDHCPAPTATTTTPTVIEPDDEDDDDDIVTEAELLEQGEGIEAMIAMKPEKISLQTARHLMSKTRVKFTDICKIDSIAEICRLDPTDINEIVTCYPEAATLLIQDLLVVLWAKQMAEVANEQAKAA